MRWARPRAPWWQWKVVGDLLPAKHQEAIDEIVAAAADDEDENPTLEAYFDNSYMLKIIKAVPAELQVRKIDGEEEDEKKEDYSPLGTLFMC